MTTDSPPAGAAEQDLKRMLGVYFEQNVTTEQYEDYDVTAGSLWANKGRNSWQRNE